MGVVTVNFRGDTLFAVQEPDGVNVAIKPICDSLGLAWNKQLERLKRDPILSEGMTMMVMPSPGGPQETTLLRLELVHGWLFTIDEGRVKDEDTRQRVLSYKRECYAALFAHFYGRHVGPVVPEVTPAREETVSVRRGLVSEARHVFGVKAAGSLWFTLGLPVVPEMREGRAQGEFGFTYTAQPLPPRPAEAA